MSSWTLVVVTIVAEVVIGLLALAAALWTSARNRNFIA